MPILARQFVFLNQAILKHLLQKYPSQDTQPTFVDPLFLVRSFHFHVLVSVHLFVLEVYLEVFHSQFRWLLGFPLEWKYLFLVLRVTGPLPSRTETNKPLQPAHLILLAIHMLLLQYPTNLGTARLPSSVHLPTLPQPSCPRHSYPSFSRLVEKHHRYPF
jgi:hypothetical protein